ncbi:MAG: hypothetical protein V3V46_07980, partial [Anaerolineales bacterium]
LMLISAGSLVYEISLTRIFAVQQFHHFAFLVVGMAVMGIAASGFLIAIRPSSPPASLLALGYSGAVLLAYLIINLLPFDSYSIAWDRQQVWILLLYFLASGGPFLFTGWAVGAALANASGESHRLYAASMIGSGAGCLMALAGMELLGGEGAIGVAITLGLFAAAVFSARLPARAGLLALGSLTLFIFTLAPHWLRLQLSPYKPLSTIRLVPDAELMYSSWSASSRVDVIESESIHVFPGLSLSAPGELPVQAGLYVDGEGPQPITNIPVDDPVFHNLASHMPGALAYILRPHGAALILNPGAGLSPLLALASGAEHVTIPTDNPLVTEVLESEYLEYSQGLYSQPRLTVSPRSSRGLLSLPDKHYAVIEFALSDSFRPVTSGAFSLSENFLLTKESLIQAWNRLANDGLLVITRWVETPPSESARAWSTLLAALHEMGVSDIKSHAIAYRGMRTATMIASRRPFTDAELALVRNFLQENGFDAIVLPNLETDEINRRNILPEPVYHQLYTNLLENHETTIRDYPFDLTPPRDKQPYFFHFFRWRQTADVLATLGKIWQPFGGSGYFVLVGLLVLMFLLGIPLIIAPLYVLRQRSTAAVPRASMLLYFGSLGAGYLLIEIPLIQSLGLPLDQPTLALATVLFILLLASGLGSLLSPRLSLRPALLILILIIAMVTIALPTFVQWILPLPLYGRIVLTIVILFPLGLLMGVPFASGLAHLETHSSHLIPWAWAINGALSGVSGVLAAMISLSMGFQATLFTGGLIYLVAWFAAPYRKRR